MSHGLYAIAEVIIAIISEVFFGEDVAFEFEVPDERVGLHILIIFEKDVVLDFHKPCKIENRLFVYAMV